MPKKTPIIIAGPTASGKSDIAETLCDKLNGVIINADSLQIYKGLPLLTAQPTVQKDRHFLYNYLEPWDKCDVARWLTLVHVAIEQAQLLDKQPIIVGGTGFYIKALMQGIAPIPEVPESILHKADDLIRTHGIEFLYEDLCAKTTVLPNHLKVTDAYRIIRAWTVLETTGKPLDYWHALQKDSSGQFIKILAMHDRDTLYKRINERFVSMWNNGILTEVQVFSSTYQEITDNHAAKAIGFVEANACLKGICSETKAIDQAQTKTRQYAKRQLTWFRHQYKADMILEGANFNIDKALTFCHKSGI